VLSAPVQTSTFAFLSMLDERLPGRLTGLYVVGSAALGDYSERVSNLDLVAVSDESWTDSDLALATTFHNLLKAPGAPMVAYLGTGDLATDPRSLERPCYRGTTRVASGELVNPFTWQVLATGAVDLRGPDHPRLWEEPSALAPWATARLQSVWAPEVPHLGRVGAMWLRRRVSSVVMEVSRLAVAARTGRALSKTEAARVLEPQVPGRFRRILADAVGYRYGGRTSMYWGPLERKQNALELLRELVGGTGPALRS
jgi:hypothetical protein